MEYTTFEYDVVVVGSGGAGLRAAIAAKEAGANPIILTKGSPQWSGGTLSAHYSFCAIIPDKVEGDSPEIFAKDILNSSEGIANPKLVEILTEQAGQAVSYASSLGVRFDTTEDDKTKIHLGWLAGHTYARALHVGNVVGRDLMRALLKRVKKLDIPIKPYTFATDLIVEENQCKGIVAYDMSLGELHYYKSPSVILATGGGSQVYDLNTNPTEATGDGYALAIRAGIPLVDMEFVQHYPTVLVSPHGARGLMFNSGILIPKGARLLNKHGEDFWDSYNVGPLKNATRDTMTFVMSQEVQKGYATENGGLWISTKGMNPEDFPQMQEKLLQELGIDENAERREIAPGAHYFMGGIQINEKTETSVLGIYAAGECTGGIHGANRLAGNAISENQVFGAIAGREAGNFALKTKVVEASKQAISRALSPLVTILQKAGKENGLSPVKIEKDLKVLMQQFVGATRDENGLSNAMALLTSLENKINNDMAPRTASKIFNRDIAKALDLRNLRDSAEAITVSARHRKESRGAHVRLDFNSKDVALQNSFAIKKQESNWKISKVQF